MLTPEERIAKLEEVLDWVDDIAKVDVADALVAVASEIRALRLMLQTEIREATWPLKELAKPERPDRLRR